ncbi:TAXI family TRAP transporter solute-binding subunit [Kitasatospora sp. RB6PN24]|uniref:TAXI family TRAP transporter solute-binding subunit n=1 Tax=Kitasatospora humi TaxID=2893891 RepID=UPI001E4CDB7D|nr:TAXI family TRAP transporter solute-binding subunit [Kitasatospora humi]MCC9309190.1 TAXI family TRAP transporter solute-binding subunit [Kitasatospora humi]
MTCSPARRCWPLLAALLLLVGSLTGWWLGTAGPGGYPKGVQGFATGVPAGVYSQYGAMLKGYVQSAMPGVRVRLDDSQGSVDNLDRVVSGQDAFAFATADAVTQYRNSGWQRLRAVARLYDDYLQLVVPADSPVQRVADLKGMRVGVGQPLSGVNLVTNQLLTVAGIDPKTGIKPYPLDVGAAAKELAGGDLDAFFWSGGLPTGALTQLSNTFPIRIVPLGDLANALHDRYPDSAAYRTSVLPAAVYGKNQAVLTLAVPNLLITRDDVSPSLVEGLTRSVIASRDVIGSAVHSAQLVDLGTAVYTEPLPLHQGAQAYYRSVKP